MLEQHIPQNAILALTFTNKAAREMEERVKELTKKKLSNLGHYHTDCKNIDHLKLQFQTQLDKLIEEGKL
jgi:superfamily I DNA/RNA helicase